MWHALYVLSTCKPLLFEQMHCSSAMGVKLHGSFDKVM
jgi:hypothetical protein